MEETVNVLHVQIPKYVILTFLSMIYFYLGALVTQWLAQLTTRAKPSNSENNHCLHEWPLGSTITVHWVCVLG